MATSTTCSLDHGADKFGLCLSADQGLEVPRVAGGIYKFALAFFVELTQRSSFASVGEECAAAASPSSARVSTRTTADHTVSFAGRSLDTGDALISPSAHADPSSVTLAAARDTCAHAASLRRDPSARFAARGVIRGRAGGMDLAPASTAVIAGLIRASARARSRGMGGLCCAHLLLVRYRGTGARLACQPPQPALLSHPSLPHGASSTPERSHSAPAPLGPCALTRVRVSNRHRLRDVEARSCRSGLAAST